MASNTNKPKPLFSDVELRALKTNVPVAGKPVPLFPEGLPWGNSSGRYNPMRPSGNSLGAKIYAGHLSKKKVTNDELKKMIYPKSPVAVLHEIVGGATYSYLEPEHCRALENYGSVLYTVRCEVNGETFTGMGPSKMVAKNICAENAIHAIATQRNSGYETPWSHLACLGLFKLFNDWQANGMGVPEHFKRPGGQCVEDFESQGPKPYHPTKQLPDIRNPVQLLNELSKGLVFTLVSEEGSHPNMVFTMGSTVEGKEYRGVGRNKKEAKKNCSLEILKNVFEVTYPEEEPTADPEAPNQPYQ